MAVDPFPFLPRRFFGEDEDDDDCFDFRFWFFAFWLSRDSLETMLTIGPVEHSVMRNQPSDLGDLQNVPIFPIS